MRIACLLIPHFALACELAEQPGLGGDKATVAIIEDRIVREVSPAARRYGVWPGQRLQEAFAACRYLVTVEARPGHYERRFQIILDRLAEISPDVEPGPLGTAYIDIKGLERHYPLPGTIESKLLSCAQAALRPRLGIAPGKFPAYVVASRMKPGKAKEIAPGQVTYTLAPVPVDLLPVDQRIIRRLHHLGLHTLGELAALPRHAVAAQFGPEGALAWDLASGNDPSAVRPAPPDESIEAEQFFVDPLTSREIVVAAVEQVLSRGARALSERHQSARLALVHIEMERGRIWEKQVTFKEPRAGRNGLWSAIRPVVESAELSAPVTGVRLSLTRLTSFAGWQGTLWTSERRQQREKLQEALRQLKARYGGACPVGRVVEVEPWSRVPERRAAIVAFDP